MASFPALLAWRLSRVFGCIFNVHISSQPQHPPPTTHTRVIDAHTSFQGTISCNYWEIRKTKGLNSICSIERSRDIASPSECATRAFEKRDSAVWGDLIGVVLIHVGGRRGARVEDSAVNKSPPPPIRFCPSTTPDCVRMTVSCHFATLKPVLKAQAVDLLNAKSCRLLELVGSGSVKTLGFGSSRSAIAFYKTVTSKPGDNVHSVRYFGTFSLFWWSYICLL